MLESEISESMIRAKEAKTIDVAFLVDSTSSMETRIEAAKQKMVAIQTGILKASGAGATVRFAVVAYRDYCDTNKLEVQEFTPDVDLGS